MADATLSNEALGAFENERTTGVPRPVLKAFKALCLFCAVYAGELAVEKTGELIGTAVNQRAVSMARQSLAEAGKNGWLPEASSKREVNGFYALAGKNGSAQAETFKIGPFGEKMRLGGWLLSFGGRGFGGKAPETSCSISISDSMLTTGPFSDPMKNIALRPLLCL